MDGSFDPLFFIFGSMLFFVLPFTAILIFTNFLVTQYMNKHGKTKSRYYRYKLVGVGILALVAGLLIYDLVYKIMAAQPQY